MMKDFSEMLCNFYMAALTALLPLYTRGTYIMLGDAKYALFCSVSLLCLGLGAAVLMGWLIQKVDTLRSVGGKAWLGRKGLSGQTELRAVLSEIGLSSMDICVMLYGVVTILSALCSSYGVTAWTGYRDWHMGAISQLLFVGIYFFVSRWYQGSAWPVRLWETAFFLVTILGFCSRLGLDPLGLLEGFNSGDWEYSHLISTMGNINWFCGYCAVALAMPVAGYMKGRNQKKRVVLYFVSVLGLILLCVQGSDVGPVLAAVCLGSCLLWSRRDVERFCRMMLLASGVVLGLPCYSGLVAWLGENARRAQPADGLDLSLFGWGGWWLAGFACIGLYTFIRVYALSHSFWKTGATGQPSRENTYETGNGDRGEVAGKKRKRVIGTGRVQDVADGVWLGMVVLAAALLLAGGAWYLTQLSGSAGWLSGRGTLWRLSWQGFLRGDWKQKLLGAGPDCFAEYIYSTFPPSELPVVEGYWAESIFANAHNQCLNHLVNMGLPGLACAVGIFVAALRRYRRYLPGMLALVMYGTNSLVSFQQVLSTPLFFLMLGICEYTVRRNGTCIGIEDTLSL